MAFYAYAYVKVDRDKYKKCAQISILCSKGLKRLTAWSRASLQFGKCFAYFLAQIIILLELGDYQTLNYISLGSLSLTLFIVLALPWVDWRELVAKREVQNEDGEKMFSQKAKRFQENQTIFNNFNKSKI